MNNKIDWLETLIDTLKELNGSATLSQIYDHVRSKHNDLSKNGEAKIRQKLGNYSKSSMHYQKKVTILIIPQEDAGN